MRERVCVCMHVCVGVYARVCVGGGYMYARVCVCEVCVGMCMHVCTCLSVHIYIHTPIHKNIHIYTHAKCTYQDDFTVISW